MISSARFLLTKAPLSRGLAKAIFDLTLSVLALGFANLKTLLGGWKQVTALA
jgi:hypothetical protein